MAELDQSYLDEVRKRGEEFGRPPWLEERLFAVALPGGDDIKFAVPRRLTEAEWRHFLEVLAVMKPGLVEDESTDDRHV